MTLRIAMTAYSKHEAWLLAAVELLRPIFAAKNILFRMTAKSLVDLPSQEHAVTTSATAVHAAP